LVGCAAGTAGPAGGATPSGSSISARKRSLAASPLASRQVPGSTASAA
jgi:hypothetical protein